MTGLALLLLGLVCGVLAYWLITVHGVNPLILVPSIVAATNGAVLMPSMGGGPMPLVVIVHWKPVTQGSTARTRYGMRDDNGDRRRFGIITRRPLHAAPAAIGRAQL